MNAPALTNTWERGTDMAKPTVEQRFWAKVDVTDDCWFWTASGTGNGYGRFWDGQRGVLAHRWSYEQLVGPIPDRLQLDHLCRVRNCVNPAHLEPVTNRENGLRGTGGGWVNRHKTHCRNGHEYTPENTYRRPSGSRICNTCARDDRRRYRERRRAIAGPSYKGEQ